MTVSNTEIASFLKTIPKNTVRFIQYFFKNNRRKGVVAVEVDLAAKTFRMGWSLCKTSPSFFNADDADTFSAEKGRHMAIGRLINTTWDDYDFVTKSRNYWATLYTIPDSMNEFIATMILPRISRIIKNSTKNKLVAKPAMKKTTKKGKKNGRTKMRVV